MNDVPLNRTAIESGDPNGTGDLLLVYEELRTLARIKLS